MVNFSKKGIIFLLACIFLLSVAVLIYPQKTEAACGYCLSSCASYCGKSDGCDCNASCGNCGCASGSRCDCYEECSTYWCWGSSAGVYYCKSGCASAGYYAPASSECCSGLSWNSSTKKCESACKCTSGACCDGCNYRSTSYACYTEYGYNYGCPWGTACSNDVGYQYRYRYQYCPGNGSSCTGSYGSWSGWSSWYVQADCSASQYCIAGLTFCNSQCTSGTCCDGCRYRPTSYACSSWTEYACPWGTACGNDVGSRTNTQYCSGSGTSCSGSISYGSWSTYDNCDSMETCAAGDSSCNTTASCDTTAPSGTLTVSPNPAQVGQTITITITATDNYDVNQIQAYYQGSWHTQWCDGIQTSCTRTWTLTESTTGTYTYKGFVYDSNSNGAWTSPSSINIPVVSCQNPTGAISSSKPTVNTGETFTITVIGNDDNDVYYNTYNKGSNTWNDTNKQQCIGAQTTCTKTWDISESVGGTYTYYGWVQDSDNSGGHGCAADHKASIGSVTVIVTQINPPTVRTDPADYIEETSARLHGYLTSDGGAVTDLRFQWGDTASYSSTSGWLEDRTSGTYFYVDVGLSKGKTYHFQAQGQNSAGWGYGLDSVFTTKPDPPSSFSATAISASQIDLSWPKGSGAYYTKVQRKTGSYPTSPSDGIQVYYDTGTSYSDTGLTAGTTYYYSAWSRAYEEGYYQYSDTYVTASETATTPMRDCNIACVNQGYPGGYCAATNWAQEQCVSGGYSLEVVDIGFQGKCVVPFILIGSCQCCQPMIATQITGFSFDPSSITLGQQTAVRGYLKTLGGAGISGETLKLMYYGTDSLWHSTGQTGATGSGGYMGFYWTPGSFYQGTVSYRLEFAGRGNYNPSQSAGTNLTVTATCTAPGLSVSPCSQQSAHAINFSWNVVSGAANYRVEWCNTSYNFGDANCCSGTCYAVTSNTYYYVYGLSIGTAYKFRVRVDSATGCAVPGAWSSNQQCATTSQDVEDCNLECSRRGYGYPRADCYPLIGGYIPCGQSQTNYGDPIGKYGACSGLFVGGCVCCHDCPSTPPSDYVTVGSCNVSITGKGWDATDGVIFGYRHLDKDTTWRKFSMDDNPGDSTCGDNLELQNSWSISGDTIIVQTDVLGKSATHSLGGGFNFNPGVCEYTVSKIGVAGGGNETYTNAAACMVGTNPLGITGGADQGEYVRWLIDMEYCGDEECNCEETCTSCVGDCGSCDTTPPTSKIISIKNSVGEYITLTNPNKYLKADTYTITTEDSDNTGGSGLNICQLGIFDATVGSWVYRTRTCNSTITFVVADPIINPSADCKTQGNLNICGIWTIAQDKIGLFSAYKDRVSYTDGNYRFYGVDWTPPTGH